MKLIRHKYVGENQFLDAPKKSGSVVWNSNMMAKAVLRDGYEYRLGDDSSSFWSAPWSKFGKLSDQVWYVYTHDIHLTVVDVVQDDIWQLTQLYTQLPTAVLGSILSMSVCFNYNIPDGFSWKGNVDGIYTAKAGCLWSLTTRTTWVLMIIRPLGSGFGIFLVLKN